MGGTIVAVDDSTKDDEILTQAASPPSSHIVVSPPAMKYDVFLSFRGEDTRHTFASYLYKGLCNAGIHTFMDYELCKGEHISQVLLRTIEESKISMIIFSENYASSTWCMDELFHILECKKKFGRVVIPIFYNMDPSNVRKQNGSFGNGFDVLKRRFEDNQEKMQKWRNALIQSTSLSGWDSKNTRPEFKFVEEIVKDALSKLNYNSSDHHEGLVGIAHHIKIIENLLTEAHIVGIWGMGGADLVKKMGLKIARNQLTSDAKTPVRLWQHEDITNFFIRGKGIEAIRCLSFDMSMVKSTISMASIFQMMHNLIYLKVYKSDQREPPMLNICGVLDHLSEELRFLSWKECPLSYVPLYLCAKNLITLKMHNSNIQQLWEGTQHFQNLERIDLSHSKHLTALPDLSQAPKIKSLNVVGCVNLAQIHCSAFLEKDFGVNIRECGPMQIKVGGSMKGRSSGFVIVSSCLDLHKFSFNKLTMKVFVCGNMICGVRFKHEVMPLEEIKELRKRTQSLGSLLLFVRTVEWLEGPIEFGHDFNKHFDHYSFGDAVKRLKNDDMKERGDRGEMMNKHQVVTMLLMEDDEEDDVLMENCCSKSVTFTRVPNSITRWSLLKKLTLKSLPHSNEYFRGMKPHLDVTYSFPNIIPSSALRGSYHLIWYESDANERHGLAFFQVELGDWQSLDSMFDSLRVWCIFFFGGIGELEARIHRKRG